MKLSTNSSAFVIAAAAVLCVGVMGCGPGKRSTAAVPQHFTVQTAGYSVENRPIDLYSAGDGPETIFVFATIHGDEQAGIPLTYRLMERLRQRSDLTAGRRILIIPNANPDGVVRNTRGNANGIDLNRNFPAANRENNTTSGYSALSEPESQLLYDLINTHKPIRIISIHQPLKCIDYDGPGESLAHFMAAFSPMPVRKLGARPGSFGSFAGEELGIPVITLEFAREDDLLSPEDLWARYGASLLAAISYPLPPY
ncbi:MAG: murein peptide amidase A [Smithella sp.]|nr:murein peptide amidase A [Smithella sp.]NLW84425.1 murein peptide amidase A [Phycisphaerae bacterium]